jgi:hypothetical protein
MILDARVAPLVPWFASLQEQAIAAVSLAIDGVCITGLRRVQELLAAVREVGGRRETGTDQIGWRAALEQEIRPVTRAVQAAMRGAEARFTTHAASQPLRAALRARLAALPDALALEVDPKDPTSQPLAAPGPSIPLRRWFELTLGAALCGIFEALEEQLGAALAAGNAELARIETVLDYHLFIVDEGRDVATRDESARVGLDHAIRLVQAQEAALDGQRERALRRFLADSSSQMDDALAPLRARRPDEILRALATHDSKARPGPLRASPRSLPPPLRRDPPRHVRPLPAAPRARGPCRKVFEAWRSDRRVRRRPQLPARRRRPRRRQAHPRQPRPRRAPRRPPRPLAPARPPPRQRHRLCAAIADATDAAPGRLPQRSRPAPPPDRRPPGDRARERRADVPPHPEGLARVQAFLDLLRATDDRILWIVLMVSPTATLLETCLRLSLYFSQVVRLPPAPGAFLEDMLRARHRVSRPRPALQGPPRPRRRAPAPPLHPRRRPPRPRRRVVRRPRPHLRRQPPAGPHLLAARRPRRPGRHRGSPSARSRASRGRALTQLSLPQRLVLATLVQHGALTEAQILETLPQHGHGAAPEIDDLRRRRLVEPCPDEAGYLQLRASAALPVTLDLRWRNML